MPKIKYEFVDRTSCEVEVSEEFYAEYQRLEKKDRLSDRKETRRHQSLDKLSEYDDFLIEKKEPTPLDILISKEQTAAVLAVLSEKQRQAVVMFYIDSYSKKEIAKRLNVDESSVRERIESAIKKLRKKL